MSSEDKISAPRSGAGASSGDLPPLVSCVVVNWNGWQDTNACLAALALQEYTNLRVIVVDNGSTNGSARQISQMHPWVTLIETGSNLGFAGGCNVGTRLAVAEGADYLWLLNNDTVAPPDTASKLVQAAQANPEAGAIGSVLYYMHDPAKVQAWGGGSVNLWSGYVSHFRQPAAFGRNSFFTAASVLIPERVCREVGVLNEGFFMYADDADFCLRLHAAGYSLAMAEETAILHKEGGSAAKRDPSMDAYATTSMMRLLTRHAPVPPVSVAVYLLLRLANRLRRGEWTNIAGVLKGVGVYFREWNVVFTDRL